METKAVGFVLPQYKTSQTQRLKFNAKLYGVTLASVETDLLCALDLLASRKIGLLIVGSLPSLAKSVRELGAVLKSNFSENGYHLLALDELIDTRTADGRGKLDVAYSVCKMATVAPIVGQEVADRAKELRAQGESLRTIALSLAVEGHMARNGKPFFAQQISNMLKDGESSLASNQEVLVTPTEIALLMNRGGPTAVDVLLERAGYQTCTRDARNNRIWALTEKGAQYGRVCVIGRQRGSGALVTQIKWVSAVMDKLGRKYV